MPWTPAPLLTVPPPDSSTSACHWNTTSRTTGLQEHRDRGGAYFLFLYCGEGTLLKVLRHALHWKSVQCGRGGNTKLQSVKLYRDVDQIWNSPNIPQVIRKTDKIQHVGGLTKGHLDPIHEAPGTVHRQLHEWAQKQDLQHRTTHKTGSKFGKEVRYDWPQITAYYYIWWFLTLKPWKKLMTYS